MSRLQKDFSKLDALEDEFRQRLIKALEVCASGSDSLFFLAYEMQPDHWPPNLRSRSTEDLLELSAEVLNLRSRLKLSHERCLALQFREACEVASNVDDQHRLGTRRYAEQMLAEIENM